MVDDDRRPPTHIVIIEKGKRKKKNEKTDYGLGPCHVGDRLHYG